MSILKGFAELSVLVNNADDITSPIGEISSDSRTFVKDIKVLTNAAYPGITYLNMQALTDTLTETTITLDQTMAMLTVIGWIHTNAQSGEIGPSQTAFTQLFETRFENTYSLLRSTSHVNVNNTWYPRSVTFCLTGREAVDAWTIWFSDELFSAEFDVTKIYVISAIENLDLFFSNPTVVQNALNLFTPTRLIEKVEEIRGPNPYTVLRSDPFPWFSTTSPQTTLTTFWTTVIYGRQGNNIDSVKEAIVAYVLANSTHTLEEWGQVFPDIFRSTEMIAAPAYYNYAIPPQQTERGMYSAIVSDADMTVLLKTIVQGNGYSASYIEDHVTTLQSTYRSVALGAIMGPENRDGYKTLRQLYSDYLAVATNHASFGLMTELTREFVMILNEMLMEAETLTPTSSIPLGFTRVHRNGVWYIAKNHNNLLLLVATKYSIDTAATALSLPTDL